MSEKKPVPAAPVVERIHCPVCGKAVYSRAGVHPQCAMARESAALRAAQKAVNEAAPQQEPNHQWLKKCPHCGRQVPLRRFTCDCGQRFPTTAAPPPN